MLGIPVVGISFGRLAGGLRLPSARHVMILGTPAVGEPLWGVYQYSGKLPESGSTYQWYRDGQPIAGATGSVYVLTVDDLGAMITFEVTPSDGVDTGKPVMSAPVGPVTQILVMNRYNYVLETE